MSQVVAIVGESSTGKSASLRNLDPKDTYIIQVLDKMLPFPGSKKAYNEKNKNRAYLSDANSIVAVVQALASSRPEIKNIIIDDANHIMIKESFAKLDEKGYAKFNELASNMVNVIASADNTRDDLNLFIMFHPEVEQDIMGKASRRIKTLGRILSTWFHVEELFTTVLYTKVTMTGDNANYEFVTNQIAGYPAKSPMGMFETKTIPNDLAIVVKALEGYHNQEIA